MSYIHELTERAHTQSADKGFHDYAPAEPRAILALDGEKIALIHSEVSEALEAMRTGRPVNKNWYTLPGVPGDYASIEQAKSTHHGPNVNPKPEGVPSELADVVIRVMDFCGTHGIDLEAVIIEKLDYNATRGHKHGGKAF